MTTLSAYLQTWQLKLSHAKTMTAAFHLHNGEAKHELKVKNNGKFCPGSTYLGVKLDRALMYCHHLEAMCKKISMRILLLRRLKGSGWRTGAKTLCTAASSLICSTARYCAPAWCCSAHTCFVHCHWMPMSNSNRHLPVLSGIQPAELHCQGVTLSLANRSSLDPGPIFCMAS